MAYKGRRGGIDFSSIFISASSWYLGKADFGALCVMVLIFGFLLFFLTISFFHFMFE
jgi:hypothetical protein